MASYLGFELGRFTLEFCAKPEGMDIKVFDLMKNTYEVHSLNSEEARQLVTYMSTLSAQWNEIAAAYEEIF